jgi:hypothetical protein
VLGLWIEKSARLQDDIDITRAVIGPNRMDGVTAHQIERSAGRDKLSGAVLLATVQNVALSSADIQNFEVS